MGVEKFNLENIRRKHLDDCAHLSGRQSVRRLVFE